MSNELKFLIKLVKEASLLVNDKFEVKEKKGELVGDLVTNYDYEIEKYMIDSIKANYPGFSIISEEYNTEKGLYTVEGPKNILGEFKMKQFNNNYRDFHCASINFAYVACGKLSATNFVWDTFWDYIPGQFIVEKAGGVSYNDTKMHIAANNEEFLQLMKNNSSVTTTEQVTLVKSNYNM